MRFAWRVSALVMLLVGTGAWAQTPNHLHYARSSERYDAPFPTGQVAPRLQKLGTHKFPVTTNSEPAQLFINQGMNLAYGFNHAEAGRAFREAARLDSDCAMAYWGEALVLGPNINAPMESDDEPKAHELARKAAGAEIEGFRTGAGLHRCIGATLFGKSETRSQGARPRIRECDACSAQALSG